MQEIVELRIYKKYAHLLLDSTEEGKDLGLYISVDIPTDDPKFEKARMLTKEVKERYNDFFFLYSEIKRKYSLKELEAASLLHVKIKTTFEPTGEECGTIYNETAACKICGANRKQEGSLKLKKNSIPKKDVAKTIAGEVVVSEKFVDSFKKRKLRGIVLEPVMFEKGTSNYYQLVAPTEVELSQSTVAGINPFDLSTCSEDEVYKCPKGHTIGLNLLSEPCVVNSSIMSDLDFFASKQKIGVKRGLLRPEPLYFCSQAFRRMVLEEKLKGFDFEVAKVGTN